VSRVRKNFLHTGVKEMMRIIEDGNGEYWVQESLRPKDGVEDRWAWRAGPFETEEIAKIRLAEIEDLKSYYKKQLRIKRVVE